MRFNLAHLALGTLLASSVNALPEYERRAAPPACARDSCARAGNTARHSSECHSYLRKTVSPCPVTQTQTIKSTETAQSVVRTVTTSIAFGTTSITSTSTQFVSPTTITAKVMATETETETVTTTITSQSDATTTTTPSTTMTLDPREESSAGLAQELEERNYNVRCPTTQSASRLPACASTCRRAEAYASACSCLGVKPGTTTLRASTVTTTVRMMTTVTSTSTTTVTSNKPKTTRTIVVTTSKATATPSTVSTIPFIPNSEADRGRRSQTDSPQVTSTFATTTTTITQTVTETAEPTPIDLSYGCFNARVSIDSRYMTGALLALGESGFFGFASNYGDTFGLNPKGQLFSINYESDGGLILTGGGFVVGGLEKISTLSQSTMEDIQPADAQVLSCTVDRGTKELECMSANGNVGWWYCGEISQFLYIGEITKMGLNNCSRLRVKAEEGGCER